MRRPKSSARKAYDRLSHVYDLLASSSETQFIHLGLEMLAISPGEPVLEIGCGTGNALEELSYMAGDSGLVCGLDLSPGMLRVAASKLGKIHIRRRAILLCGDGAELPYSSGSFTSLFMSFTLELFDTPMIPMVLAECWRVLKPGGRLGVVAMFKSNRTSWNIRLYEWVHEHFPTYVDCRPIDARAVIQAAGFSINNQVIKSMWGLPVALIGAMKE